MDKVEAGGWMMSDIVEALVEKRNEEGLIWILEKITSSSNQQAWKYLDSFVSDRWYQRQLEEVLGEKKMKKLHFLFLEELKKEEEEEEYRRSEALDWTQDPLGPYIRDLMEMNALLGMKRENFREKYDRAISDLETHIRKKYPDIDL